MKRIKILTASGYFTTRMDDREAKTAADAIHACWGGRGENWNGPGDSYLVCKDASSDLETVHVRLGAIEMFTVLDLPESTT